MGVINVLGFDIANLIAAGEVVDRPSSVVKELLENSLDSGAKNITVEIRSGGTSFIRITDDGCGMSHEDLPVSILRHATSKIADSSDLEKIMTLGFRGEALAAISSVSKMTIVSKQRNSPLGSELIANCGEVISLNEVGCPDGTVVTVSEIFANVPARRKFLKKDATETAAITGVVEKIALSSPNISITYITDGERRFRTPGNGNLEGLIFVLFGKEVASRIRRIERSEGGMTVSGYISEPDLYRPNRNMQNFFINHRYVKSRTMAAALEQAYATHIPPDKFPFCVINLEISPEAVDVNVHPSKLEVKFTNERVIFEAVYYAVLSSLEESGTMPSLTVSHNKAESRPPENVNTQKSNSSFWVTGKQAQSLMNAFAPDKKSTLAEQIRVDAGTPRTEPQKTKVIYTDADFEDKKPVRDSFEQDNYPKITNPAPSSKSESPKIDSPRISTPTSFSQPVIHSENTDKDAETEPISETEVDQIPEYTILGEAYNCYIIVQLEDRLIFIDKHAAHESMLFDSLCDKMKNKQKHSQILMFPIEVTLTESELDGISEFKEDVKAIGFNFDFMKGGVSVSEIPDEISRESAKDMLISLASSLSEGIGTVESVGKEYFEKRLYQASCKAAIKGGRVYSTDSLRSICDRVLCRPNDGGSAIKTCPHGRPVAFELKKNSIERQFQRLL